MRMISPDVANQHWHPTDHSVSDDFNNKVYYRVMMKVFENTEDKFRVDMILIMNEIAALVRLCRSSN